MIKSGDATVLFYCCIVLMVLAPDARAFCGNGDQNEVNPVPLLSIKQTFYGQTAFSISWEAPNKTHTGYFYLLDCTKCSNMQINTTRTNYEFTNRTAGSDYSILISAGLANCRTSIQATIICKTRPNILVGSVNINNVTETSFSASWTGSSGTGVAYNTSCSAGKVDKPVAVCSGLPSGSEITFGVRAVRDGVPDNAGNVYDITGAAKTKLFSVEKSATISTSESILAVSWTPSKTKGVSYLLICSSDIGNRSEISTNATSATCYSLQSGESYSVTVTVKKTGGFEDAVTDFGMYKTKLSAIESSSAKFNASKTGITVSWEASKAIGVTYELSCRRADGSRTQSIITNKTVATCDSLESGESYNLTVAVKKTGFEDTATVFKTQLTRLFPVTKSSTQMQTSATSVTVSWDSSRTRNVNYTLICESIFHKIFVETSANNATCASMFPGRTYELKIIVKKSGGFRHAVTELGTHETNETPSSSVRYLQVKTDTAEGAMVMFDPPEMENGVVLAYGIQIIESAPSFLCSQMMVLNVSFEFCQISNCTTDDLIKQLAQDCAHIIRRINFKAAEHNLEKVQTTQTVYSARIERLKSKTNFTVRVIPVSQTMLGQSAELEFCIGGCLTSTNNWWLKIEISLGVSFGVLLVTAILVTLTCVRKRNSAKNKEIRMDPPYHKM